ncbi:MAG: SLC13 family permease [Pseudomonadota bacterium]
MAARSPSGRSRRSGRRPPRIHRPLAVKALAVTLLMVGGFFLFHPPAKLALIAGAVLLLTRRIKPERVYREIDWTLLLMFAGLFVVVAGLRKQC